jgi:ubiquinol-cytochrome c reductase subunit 7
MRDDCLNEDANVKEAIRRLPPTVYDARQFRISRALYLSMRKEILPKEEWTKMEEVGQLEHYFWFNLMTLPKIMYSISSLC